MALSFAEGQALGGSLGGLLNYAGDAAGWTAKARSKALADRAFGDSGPINGLASLLQPTQVAQNAQGMTGARGGGQATLSSPTPPAQNTQLAGSAAPSPAAPQAAPLSAAPQASGGQAFGSNIPTETLIQVLRDPNSTEQDRGLAASLFKGRQPLSQTDQADVDLKRAQIQALTQKGENPDLWAAGSDGLLYNKKTGETKQVGAGPKPETREIYDESTKSNVIAERQADGTYRPVARAPVQNRDTPPGFQAESQLSQQLIGQQPYKDYQNSRAALEKMKVGVKDPSAAGDIGMVYAYMKMLDPSSVVREGEFATAEQAGGVPTQVLNLYNKILSGERLSPEVRADFLRKGTQFVNGQGTVAGKLIGDYRDRATRYGVNPDNVAPQYREEAVPDMPGAPPVQGAKQAPDGNWYVPDPNRPGKYLQVQP